MKNLSLPPAQEAVYSHLFSENPMRKILFDQAKEAMENHVILKERGELEHDQIMDILRKIEILLATTPYSKKTKKRVFMVACELMLSRDMGLYDPIAFTLGESEDAFSLYTKIPIDVGDSQYQWLAKLEELDELFNSFNTMTKKELKKFRVALFTKPYDEWPQQKNFNWVDVARKCKRPLFYDFHMKSPAECYIAIIAQVKKK
jgi:hypothetical protein